jgi:WD40 repeat protein
MHFRWLHAFSLLAVCVLVVLVGLATGGQPAGKKKPVPSAEAQVKILKLIDELYHDDLAKAAKDTALKARLAQTLLQEGKDTTDDVAGRYVLMREAHKLAAEAGDVPTALQAAEELALSFDIPAADLFQMKVKTLGTAANAVKAPPDAYQTVVDSSLLLLEDTLAADDFPSSLTLLAAADKAALKLRNVSLVASIRKREEEVKSLQKDYAGYEPFAQQLAKDPNNTKANQEMGYYYALYKGNWDKGLPMIAHGTGPAAQAAQVELGTSKSATPLDAAARWVKFARGTNGLPRVNALLHAYQLYHRNLGTADAAQRKAIEARLEEVNSELPPEYRAGEITTELRRIDSPPGPVYSAAFSPDGKRIIGSAYDGSLRLWDTKNGKELRRLDGHLGKVWTVAFDPDGRHVASGGFDGSVRYWDLAAARELYRMPAGPTSDYVRSVCFSPDGAQILVGGDGALPTGERVMWLWDIGGTREARPFAGHEHSVWSVAFSRDGTQALSGSLDRTVRLHDVKSRQQLKKLEGHRDTVLSVAFAPDGRHALSGSTDRTLIYWDLETATPAKVLSGHTGYVHSVAISPDGRYGLSGSSDHTVRLWDLAAGQELRTLDGHRDQVWCVAFSRDGRLALSTGQDNCVRVWGGVR